MAMYRPNRFVAVGNTFTQSFDAAVAANGANGTEAKAIAALSEAAKHVSDVNQVSVDISGKPLITMPPEVTAVVPAK